MLRFVNDYFLLVVFLILSLLLTDAIEFHTSYGDNTIVFTFFIFLTIGIFLTKGASRKIFVLSYLYLVKVAFFQVAFFQSNYNLPFDSGLDEVTFFERWIMWGYKDVEGVIETNVKYMAFVVPISFYYKFINYIGFDSTLFFHSNIINCFVGSLTAVYVFKVAKLLNLEKTSAISAALFVAFYPFIAYQNAKILRDPLIYFLFTFFCYQLLAERKFLWKAIIVGCVVIVSSYVRTESVLYIFLILSIYTFFINKNISLRVVLLIGLGTLGIAMAYYVVTRFQVDTSKIGALSETYQKSRENSGAADGLGTLLLQGLGIPGKILSVPYIWLSPIPPPIIHNNTIHNLFLSVGCVVWYTVLPKAVYTLYSVSFSRNTNVSVYANDKLRSFGLAFFITSVVGTFFIAFTSGDPRHFLIFMPIMAIYGIQFKNIASLHVKKGFQFSLITLAVLAALAYIFLKTF